MQYLPVLLKPGIRPDLRRPTGPLHATLRSHDSSSLLPAPAQWQKPSVAFPPSEQRGPRGARTEWILGQPECHSTPEQAPLPKPAFRQLPSRHLGRPPSGGRERVHVDAPPCLRSMTEPWALSQKFRKVRDPTPCSLPAPSLGWSFIPQVASNITPSHTTSAFHRTSPQASGQGQAT